MNFKFRNILFVFIGVFTASIGVAQTPLSLSKAVEKGLQNSYDIRVSQINTTIAEKQLKAAKKERLPVVNVYARQGNNIINDQSPTSFINDFYRDRSLSLGVDGEWLLFDRFQGKINKQRYQLNKEEGEMMGEIAAENTIYETLQAYYNALIKSEAVEVAKQSKKLSEERTQDVKLKESLGQASRYDVLRFENAGLLDATNVLQKETELETAMILLNDAMGNKKKVDYQLTDQLEYKSRTFDLMTLQRKLKQSNKNLLSQHITMEMVKLGTKAAENASLPTVSINSGISQRFNGTNFPEFPRIKGRAFQFDLRFSANYNLFDGGRKRRTVEESELFEQVELVKSDQLTARMGQELTRAVSTYRRHLEVLHMTERLMKNLEVNMELEQDRYTSGISSALDFRTVQLEFINTQFTRLEIIYQMILNELTILRLTGGLSKNWK